MVAIIMEIFEIIFFLLITLFIEHALFSLLLQRCDVVIFNIILTD